MRKSGEEWRACTDEVHASCITYTKTDEENNMVVIVLVCHLDKGN